MKPVCIESTLDIEESGIIVRLWINEDKIETAYYSNLGLEAKIRDFIKELGQKMEKGLIDDSPKSNNERLMEFCYKAEPRLNAIQIKNKTHGVVAYLVEFNDKDPHG